MAKEKIDVSRRRLFLGFLDRIRGGGEAERTAPIAAESETAKLLSQANAGFSAGDYTAASGLYRQFLAAEPGNLDARQRLGECLYRGGHYIQAKVEFERILQKREKENRTLLFLGLVLARLDRLPAAAAVWKRFFDPQAVGLQRELNVQLALLEMAGEGEQPDAADVAGALERALARPGA